MKTIALIGEINSGKSSLLNALAAGFVSCVSLQRETFEPLAYRFSHTKGEPKIIRQISEQIDIIHNQNNLQREQLTKENQIDDDQMAEFFNNYSDSETETETETETDAESETDTNNQVKELCSPNVCLPMIHST